MEGPVSPSERIAEIDYVRGMALLGIFIMNLPTFASSMWLLDTSAAFPGTLDRHVESLRALFIEGKFNAMFSFLFGVGFTLQMERLQQARPGAATLIYLRRVVILFALGLLHGTVFWMGDILNVYAVLGVLLLCLRKVPTRWIIVMIVLTMVAPTVSRLLHDHFDDPAAAQRFFASTDSEVALDKAIYGHGSFLDGVRRNFADFQFTYFGWSASHRMLVYYTEILTTMLLGLLAGRGRWFEKAVAYPQLVDRINRWALVVGTVSIVALHFASLHMDFRVTNAISILYGNSFRICRVVVMTFYVTGLLRIIRSTRWRQWLRPVSKAGAMPLTNYLFQTFVGLWIFRPWGLGLFDRVGPAGCLALAVGVYLCIQLPLSTIWLQRFRFGPLEYLWRAATYGYWPAMVRGVRA